MKKKILIAYATIHGSTREIAEDISNTLNHDGVPADILPASKVASLDGYDMVILGAPQYMFRWHKDALRFLAKFRNKIEKGLPVAVFAGGPIEEADSVGNKILRDRLEQELAKLPWVKPASLFFVGGKFDPFHLRFPYNLIPALKNKAAVDFRDWPAIQAWARTLPAIIQAEIVETAK